LNDEEQFVVQLSKVERLREKLAIMHLMGTFEQNVQRIGQVSFWVRFLRQHNNLATPRPEHRRQAFA
jgi:hypothetical protein